MSRESSDTWRNCALTSSSTRSTRSPARVSRRRAGTRAPVSEAYPQLPNSLFYPDLPYVCFADPAQWDWARAIGDQWQVVRREAEALLAGTASFAPYVQRTHERPQSAWVSNADSR